METLARVLIVDLGSQYTSIIERILRELGVRSAILSDPRKIVTWIKKCPPSAIIYSGGDRSVYDEGSPQPPIESLELGVPILGICYGMQWIAHELGGKVENTGAEYGKGEVRRESDSRLFAGAAESLQVWNSHGDSVTKVPSGYRVTARSPSGGIAAMENAEGTIVGVQFHPEVVDTPEGRALLSNFLFSIAFCEEDWKPAALISEVGESLRASIVPGERAIMGYSGGVDSSVVAALASTVLGKDLLLVTIDGGHLRENELEEICSNAKVAGRSSPHLIVDAREEFDRVMKDTIDAEEKRRRFKLVYTALFKKAAADFDARFVLQGTLATDRIESGATGGALIKSHHNVGLDFGELTRLDPIDGLFKYEVRALARDLDLPESISERQPFPGPGGFVRVNGVPATQKSLELWKWAQARVDEILKRRGLTDSISQLVVSVNGVKAVGVKGDARVYAHPIVVRGIKTLDFMTGKGVRLPTDAKEEIEAVLTAHKDVVCVYYNETDKPPATTEPE